jgi:hypothetical protein
MILVSSIIEQFEDAFFAKYKSFILPSHRKALRDMKLCRKEQGLHMLAGCTNEDCGKKIYIPHSCGNRGCPHCQNHENWQWIENQLSKRLTAEYFLITFTLPKQLRDLAWKNQKLIYSLMFDCVQEVLKTFTLNDKLLGGEAGFTTVLHTNTRSLDPHPHIHVVIPAASINRKSGVWRTKSNGYLFKEQNLAKVFRAIFLKKLVDQHIKIPKDCPKVWIADCKSVGNGDKALIYLGKYLYKGVIQEKDILKCENGKVTFRYKDSKTGLYRTRTVDGEKFLYLLMLHILPKGFRRVRSYGFLHPRCKKLIKFLQLVLRINPLSMLKRLKERAKIICPVCQSTMKILMTRIRKPPIATVSNVE